MYRGWNAVKRSISSNTLTSDTPSFESRAGRYLHENADDNCTSEMELESV